MCEWNLGNYLNNRDPKRNFYECYGEVSGVSKPCRLVSAENVIACELRSGYNGIDTALRIVAGNSDDREKYNVMTFNGGCSDPSVRFDGVGDDVGHTVRIGGVSDPIEDNDVVTRGWVRSHGGDSDRPTNPVPGMFWYNRERRVMEYWNETTWVCI